MKRKHISKQTLLVLLIAVFTFGSVVMAQNESKFYKETIHKYTSEVNLKTAYKVNGSGNGSDSQRLQKAISDVHKKGGGIIYIPKGVYLFSNIKLKSNVHLKIEAGTEIQCFINGSNKAVTTFGLGGNGLIENVSVRGVGGSYIIRTFNTQSGSRAFGMGNVKNFLISDFICDDDFSKFSSMEFSIARTNGKRIDGAFPHNGIVKNCKSLNARYGYGFVQVQAGTNILFKNIEGDGGAVLRCETGWVLMNDLQIGGIRQIYGRNITGRNGKCAVMISPHSMHNGMVDIDGVKAYSCTYAVTIDGGYVAKRQTNPKLTRGDFTKVVVKNVEAKFGTTAQIKAKDRNWIPYYRRDLLTDVSEDFGESRIGPSIAAVRFDDHNYKDNVTVEGITACGYGCQKDIVNQNDKNHKLDCSTPDYSCVAKTQEVVDALLPKLVRVEKYTNSKSMPKKVSANKKTKATAVKAKNAKDLIGKHIWLKAINGNYVTVNAPSKNATLESSVTTIGKTEDFEIVDAGDGFFALKAKGNGNYVTVKQPKKSAQLVAISGTIGENEKFKIEIGNKGTLALFANANKKYVWCQKNTGNGVIKAKGVSIKGWVRFVYGIVE